jgi:DNA invertase Pin-like site-specific DNA recombinase
VFPAKYERGKPGEWLWMPKGSETDRRWADIEQSIREGGPTSERGIASGTGLTQPTVHRLLARYADEWTKLRAEVGADEDE